MKKYFSLVLICITLLTILWVAKSYMSQCIPDSIEPIQSLGKNNALNVLVMGDIGQAGNRRNLSINSLEKISENTHFDMALLLGDNFYPEGIKYSVDPRWSSDFEELFKPQIFDMPFYSILGNHDYQGNPQAQVDYTKISDRWKMPSRYYSLLKSINDEQDSFLLMIMLDTTSLRRDIKRGTHQQSAQYNWLQIQLKEADATHVVLVGHHTAYSNGKHGDDLDMIDLFKSLDGFHKVDLYLNGHEHNLQILKPVKNTHFVSNGSFSKKRSFKCTDNSIYASSMAIALALVVTTETIMLVPINNDGTYNFNYSL
jgi:predicted MPP superfamily phosphohydrolase